MQRLVWVLLPAPPGLGSSVLAMGLDSAGPELLQPVNSNPPHTPLHRGASSSTSTLGLSQDKEVTLGTAWRFSSFSEDKVFAFLLFYDRRKKTWGETTTVPQPLHALLKSKGVTPSQRESGSQSDSMPR